MAYKATDILAGKVSAPEGKPCGCGNNCGKMLEPRVDGERPTIDGKEVNPDCYYEAFDKEFSDHPIGGFGVRRRG